MWDKLHDSTFHTSFECLGAQIMEQIIDLNLKLYMWLLHSDHKDEDFWWLCVNDLSIHYTNCDYCNVIIEFSVTNSICLAQY